MIKFDSMKPEDRFRTQILKVSPTGKVPVLVDDGFSIWDSLAICEYLAEKFPQKQLWPRDIKVIFFPFAHILSLSDNFR